MMRGRRGRSGGVAMAFVGLGGFGGSVADLDQERGYALACMTVAWTGTIAATPARYPRGAPVTRGPGTASGWGQPRPEPAGNPNDSARSLRHRGIHRNTATKSPRSS